MQDARWWQGLWQAWRALNAPQAAAALVQPAVAARRPRPDLRPQLDAAQALARCLPVLWLDIDGGSGVLRDCSTAIVDRLGRPRADCIGQPAAALFDADDPARLRATLCLPLGSGAELGVPLRLRHRDGSAIDCVADGVRCEAGGADAARVLWVVHRSPSQARPARPMDGGDPGVLARDFDWALDCERQRLERSLQLLGGLRQRLQALHASLDRSSRGAIAAAALDREEVDHRLALLAQARQAAEQAAGALAAPTDSLGDLLAALQAMARQLAARSGLGCSVTCAVPGLRLPAAVRLVVFRASRDLLLALLQAPDRPTGQPLLLRLDAPGAGVLRVCLLRQAQGAGQAPVGLRSGQAGQPGQPGPSGLPGGAGLGLFGVRTLLAGVGGAMLEPPAQGDLLAAFQVPLAGAPPAAGRQPVRG